MLCLLGNFAECQGGLRVREHAKSGGEVLHRIVVLVQVVLHSAAQHIEVDEEFVPSRLPILQGHLLRPRFRVGLRDAIDESGVVIDSVKLARVVMLLLEKRCSHVHRLAVVGLDGHDFLRVVKRRAVVMKIHFGFNEGPIDGRAPR